MGLLDRFRRRKDEPVDDKTDYDLVDGADTDQEPDARDDRRSRWDDRRKKRRDHVIERKKAQAGIAKHRKWVMMWIAVIVVAIVVLAIFVMNKMSLTGLIF